jgi:ParB-like nuclease domain
MLAKKPQNQVQEQIFASNQPNKLSLAAIRLDGETQPRVGIDWHHIRLLEEVIIEGEDLEPVVVFNDGQSYWLADGFHRWYAHRNQEKLEIACYVKSGTRRDAILYSVGANAEHKAALPRSREDKRKAVLTLLCDPEWSQWSNVAISKACQVAESFVRKLKKETHFAQSEVTTYKNKHGAITQMRTSNIGKKSNTSPSTIENEQDNPALESSKYNGFKLEQEILICPDHPLFPGIKGAIASFPNLESAIVILETGQRELIALRHLQQYIPMDSEENTQEEAAEAQQFISVEAELMEKEKHLGLKYNRQQDRVLPFVERNHQNPTDVDDRQSVYVASRKIEVNISDVVTAFMSNLDVISEAQIRAVGKTIAIREPDKMDAMLTGLMHNQHLAKKMVKAIAQVYPDVILNFVEEDGVEGQ